MGTGQAEVAIKHYAHTVIVLTLPNMGDDIQTMKAGILEIGDIYVVNKADLPGADRAEAELEDMLHLRSTQDGIWRPPVLRTVACEGRGVEALIDQVEKHHAFLGAGGMLSDHRRRLAEFELKDGLNSLLWERAFRMLNGNGTWQGVCELVAQGRLDPWSAVQLLEDGLSKACRDDHRLSEEASLSPDVPGAQPHSAAEENRRESAFRQAQ